MRWLWSKRRDEAVAPPLLASTSHRARDARSPPLVDGHAAMLAMCQAFLSAKRYILLAAWDIRADLPMVRGEDVHVGAAGSPEQQKLYDDFVGPRDSMPPR